MKLKLNFYQIKENLIDLPFFVFRNVNVEKLNIVTKILFLIKSIIIILIFKYTHKKLFCFYMNMFFKKNGKILYSSHHNTYIKNFDNSLIHYPNKTRILGSMSNHEYELDNLLHSYSLENFEINKNDLIVDCGANVGNLFLAINRYYKNFKYIAFEPDPNAFKCLKLNTMNFANTSFHCVGLSNNIERKKFYINAETGDSSFESFRSKEIIDIKTNILDDYNFKKIKLLKIDAEGHELEVLLGSKHTLSKIEYIAVDMGAEKGESADNTVASVTNFLLRQNFELLSFKENRTTGLFKNLLYN